MIRALADAVNWLESQSPENLESEMPKLPVRFAEDEELSEAEIAVLQEMLSVFKRFNKPKRNILLLKGLLNLFSNPETEIQVPMSESGMGKSLFMFDEKMSIKQMMEFVMKFVRNKDVKTSKKNLPKYRTVIKKEHSIKKEKSKFSIDTKDLQKIRMNFAKREKTKHSVKGKNNLSLDKGRIIRFSKDKTGNIAITPTIFNALQNGNYSLQEKKFNIQTKNFLYPKYEENVVYNIMLVLDTSKSISWVIPHIEKFVSYITSNVSNSRDKLGLITFNNDLAQIYHYPTLNVKQVIGTINKMEVKGQTPLGEGLNLALQVFSKTKYRIPGMKNLLILISDCFPEPLEGGHKDLLDEPSYKLVLSAAEKIRDEKLGFIIINPSAEKEEKMTWNKKLIEKIIAISKAKYIEVNPRMKLNLFQGERAFIDEDKLNEFFDTVNEVKMKM